MSEIDEIKRKYDDGEIDFIKSDLEVFLAAKGLDILDYKESLEKKTGREIPLDLAVKMLLLKIRTINPARDIKDQLREIEREKWYVGEKTGRSPDPQDVAVGWMKSYSAGWREHRITTVIFVFEKERDRFLSILKGLRTTNTNLRK